MSLATIKTLRLRSQITWLFVVLIFLTTVAIMASIWLRTAEYSHNNIDRRMDGAQRVLNQYLTAKEQLLITAARVLTADFGFKQAVATRDENTIVSALENHGQRIQADVMMLLNTEGQLNNLAARDKTKKNAFQRALDNLPLRLENSQFLVVEKSVYQVMVLPVKAPRLIAYSVIGFKLDQSSVTELQQLMGLDISLLDKDSVIITSLNNNAVAWTFWQQASADKNSYARTLEHPLFSHRVVEFGEKSGLSALLTASLQQENEAYYRLLYSVLFIAIITLLIALISTRILAKSITTPLSNLVMLTKKIAQGQFNILNSNTPQSQEFRELEQAFVSMGKEIGQREAEIVYQAEHDLLTGLLNRHTLQKRLDTTVKKQKGTLLLGIDIKAFKQLNDTMGPKVGDSILILLAQRLNDFVMEQHARGQTQASAGRISNDFFLLVLCLSSDQDVSKYCDAVYEALVQPYKVDEMNITLDTYLGVVNSMESDANGETLLRRVNMAVNAAKNENQSIRFYRNGEDEEYLQRIAIIEELKEALAADDGSLFMTYQPKKNLKTGSIDKVEALIRWINKEGDFVNPEIFIGLAEKSGLIVDLTQWVVKTVVKQIAVWNELDHRVKVAINLSAQDIQHEGFIEHLMSVITEHKVPANQVTLELTERDIMENALQVINRLTNLKMVGFEISVDDYGIGQSSLAKLKDLPADELKIDKSFIMTLDQSESDQTIVQSTIELGHKLGMRVVAEGVENAASLQLLTDFGCDHIQGFYLSKPVKPDEFITWLKSYEASN